ncbi:MAG: site-specific DNA-methyltransferase [Fimbriimonadales bacterium]|nr:site-specific DNA-methyltransferase [Fimbriimonadales bacterium]
MEQLSLWEAEHLGVVFARTHREQLERKYQSILQERPDLAEKVSYRANKGLPLLRLYRYKEAFAYTLVTDILQAHANRGTLNVFDPFSGMGTTLFASSILGMPAWGIDRLPVGVFVANTILEMLEIEPGTIVDAYQRLVPVVASLPEASVAEDVAIMKIAFEPQVLRRLRQWKSGILGLPSPQREVMTLLFLSILEPCSYTSKDGQFLRLRRDKTIIFPDAAIAERVLAAERDLAMSRSLGWRRRAPALALLGDARALPNPPVPEKPNLVITSPPYVNRYDYTRSYSLELCFFFVDNFEQLKQLRHSVLRSHIEVKVDPSEQPSHPAVSELTQILRARREQLNNPRIPDMITGYFVDMEQVIRELGRLCAEDTLVYMVVDNVRFEGELLPVDLILCDIAEAHGFQTETIWVARYKGNSSQQMGRYGRVPVRESVVVWRKVR